MMTYAIRRIYSGKRPYGIVRSRPDGSTHRLAVKFETTEKAVAYMTKHAAILDRIA